MSGEIVFLSSPGGRSLGGNLASKDEVEDTLALSASQLSGYARLLAPNCGGRGGFDRRTESYTYSGRPGPSRPEAACSGGRGARSGDIG